jgi:hypothetical protein
MFRALSVSPPLPASVDRWLGWAGAAVLAIAIAATLWVAPAPGDRLVRNTIRLTLVWYFASLFLLLRLEREGESTSRTLIRAARWCWSWALLCFLVHVALAFHYYHDWSHRNAFQHTREVSGVGEGIYASYLFTCLWVGDVIWWWLAPSSYAQRPEWVKRTLHVWMLFIVFNGTVVYESGAVRWLSLLAFAVLGWVWWRSDGR